MNYCSLIWDAIEALARQIARARVCLVCKETRVAACCVFVGEKKIQVQVFVFEVKARKVPLRPDWGFQVQQHVSRKYLKFDI